MRGYFLFIVSQFFVLYHSLELPKTIIFILDPYWLCAKVYQLEPASELLLNDGICKRLRLILKTSLYFYFQVDRLHTSETISKPGPKLTPETWVHVFKKAHDRHGYNGITHYHIMQTSLQYFFTYYSMRCFPFHRGACSTKFSSAFSLFLL